MIVHAIPQHESVRPTYYPTYTYSTPKGSSSEGPEDRGSAGFRGPTFLLVIRSGERELHLLSLNRLQV